MSWQPFDRLGSWLQAADVLLVPPSSVPLQLVGNTVLPMKLFLYLGAGRAILAPDGPDVRELLEDGRDAVLVPPDDPSAAATALRALLADRARAERLGANAREKSRELTWDRRGQRILELLERRLEARRTRDRAAERSRPSNGSSRGAQRSGSK